MRASVGLLFLLVACTGASGVTRSEAPTTTSENSPETDASIPPCSGRAARVDTFEYESIDGVEPALLSLDVHSPAVSADCPAIIWVHGGSWQVGDKSSRATSVKADYFVDQGYVFVSINHRLVDVSNDVQWPDFGIDTAAAAAWVIDKADDIGVDSERIALIGHSSGAHLVSIVGTNPDLLAAAGHERNDVACVVSLDSVTHDLTDAPSFEVDIIDAGFGDDIDVLSDGSPTLQATEHAEDGPVPQFLIVTRGRDVRLDSAARLEAALLDGGADAEVYDASPYDHGEVSSELGVAGETNITPAVTDFLADCLG